MFEGSMEQLKAYLAEEIITSAEAVEILGISRARLSKLIQEERLVPLKKLAKESIFLKSEILEKKVEMAQRRKKYRPYESD